MAFDNINTPEDLFNELDEREFSGVAKPLAAFRRELMNQGFTRRESIRLVEAYQKFIYDISIESFIHDHESNLEEAFEASDDFREDDEE